MHIYNNCTLDTIKCPFHPLLGQMPHPLGQNLDQWTLKCPILALWGVVGLDIDRHIMHTVDRRGYDGQQKALFLTFVDRIQTRWSQFFAKFDWFKMLTSRSGAYVSRYGDFCAHNDNDNNDTTNYFTPPCVCARGNKQLSLAQACPTMLYISLVNREARKNISGSERIERI